MMLFRYCLCCFGYHQNPPNNSKRLFENQSTSNVNKQNEIYTVPQVTGDATDAGNASYDDDGAYSKYEAALSAERLNFMGSNPNLAGSVNSLIGNTPTVTETDRQSDLEKTIPQTPEASPTVTKQDLRGKVSPRTKPETLLSPMSFFTAASASMAWLPSIRVAYSSSRIDSAESATNPGIHSSTKFEREVKSLSSSPKTSSSWLKSQSMLNVSCSSFTENKQITNSRSTDDVPKKCGLDPSLYESTHLSKSIDAVNKIFRSMDDLVNENVFIDLPNGTIHFIPSYSSDTKKLSIKIEKIEGLPPQGDSRSEYNCVIKLTMLPNEKHVEFSRTFPAHGALGLDESFVFNVKDPTHKVLRISVYNSEAIGKYDAVGHALFYVIDALTHEKKSHALKLYRQSMPDVQAESQAGSIKIVFNYKKQTELLNVFVNEAYNLPITFGKSKSYLKITQYSFGRKVKEVHSPSIGITKQSRYQFTVNLKIDSKALQNSFIVISVKMPTLFKDITVGRVILGPYFYSEYGKTFTPWGRALVNRETVSHVFRLYQ